MNLFKRVFLYFQKRRINKAKAKLKTPVIERKMHVTRRPGTPERYRKEGRI